MLIWKVVYDCIFRSSSGSKKYAFDKKSQSGVVWTVGDSLSDVEAAIEEGLDNQTTLIKLVSAEYIGKTINPQKVIFIKNETN